MMGNMWGVSILLVVSGLLGSPTVVLALDTMPR